MGTAVHSPVRLADRFSALEVPGAQRQDITVLLERQGKPADGGRQVIERVSVLSGDTVADVKLKLRAKQQWFSQAHCLVSAKIDGISPLAPQHRCCTLQGSCPFPAT